MNTNRIAFLFVIVLAFALNASGQRLRPTPVPKMSAQSLDEKIQAALTGFQGKAWMYAKNLDSGTDYSFRGDEQTRTASTIKLAIMAEAFRQVSQGKAVWTD